MTARWKAHGWICHCGVFAAALVCSLGWADVAIANGHEPSGHAATEAEDAVDYSGVKTRGIDLGEYRVRSHYPVDAQKSTVRFTLHAAVTSERYAETQQLVDTHRHKLRDQVITATRMTPLTVFDEPDLENFRRRVFLRLRRALPELVIDDVYVSAFELTVKNL